MPEPLDVVGLFFCSCFNDRVIEISFVCLCTMIMKISKVIIFVSP
jgi:hypothetical protein